MIFFKSLLSAATVYRAALSTLGLLFTIVSGHSVVGQTPPDTDIFLVEVSRGVSSIQVSKPINITNRKGYDNQPSFTPDGQALLYTSGREDGQTDIYRYDLRQKTNAPLTQTPESEYSPTVTPDKAYFSVIRVEKDQNQRLWKFPVSGQGQPALVMEKVKPVGYHCWLTPDSLALFILGKPNSLQLARVSTGDTARIESNIGRSLHRVPGKNAISFVHKRTATEWDISQLDLSTQRITTIAPCLAGSEDLIWMPDGTLLMGKGAVLYQRSPGAGTEWVKLADFSASGINQITRLAISPDGQRLALVGQ